MSETQHRKLVIVGSEESLAEKSITAPAELPNSSANA